MRGTVVGLAVLTIVDRASVPITNTQNQQPKNSLTLKTLTPQGDIPEELTFPLTSSARLIGPLTSSGRFIGPTQKPKP